MSKILVGIPTVTPDKRFLETLPSFFRDAGKYHDIDCMWVWNKPLVDAQNDFAEECIKGGYDYLLSIEDDHWGFTLGMLESCISADTHVCGVSYHSRHLPFMKIPMKLNHYEADGSPRYDSIKADSGFHKADLIGFGFTLIRSDVFRILDRPFFRLNTERFKGVGPRATDIDFSMRLVEKGIHPIGCFDYTLNHREITGESYKQMLVGGIIEKQNFFSILRKNSNKQLDKQHQPKVKE